MTLMNHLFLILLLLNDLPKTVQTFAQSIMPAVSVAVILTMECLFAAIFGVIFLKDPITVRIVFGSVLMLIGMYVIILNDKIMTR